MAVVRLRFRTRDAALGPLFDIGALRDDEVATSIGSADHVAVGVYERGRAA